MPKVSWAEELGLSMDTLELERPDNWFQKQVSQLHTARAEAFAEYLRLENRLRADNPFDVFFIVAAEIVAWERYCRLTRTFCDLTGFPLPVGIISRGAERRANVRKAILKNTCTRCGFIWNTREPRFVRGLCSSCLAHRETVLRRGRLTCQPWQGRFARDDVTPITASGEPILSGYRLCKNSDCVNPKHIRKGNN